MRLLFCVLVLSYSVTPLLAQKTQEKQENTRPNIILFFVDDLGWTDLGSRNPALETPNIDLLAKSGLSFEQAYVASPSCSPSRATLLTGQHPVRLGMVRHIPTNAKQSDFDPQGRTSVPFNQWAGDPANFPSRNWLPLEHTTYAEVLREQGYYNLFVGKWHLGHEPYHPIHQGFDHQIGTSNWGHPLSYYPPYFKGAKVLVDEKKPYLTDKLTDETVSFIDTYDMKKPFMISMWYYGVHKPSIGRKDLVEYFTAKGLKGADAQYAAQIKAVDESIGHIRQILQTKGLAQTTVIIFTSDQGSWFSNPPYRGSKRKETLFEGGARVPFFVYWPGTTKPSSKNNAVIQTTDLFPTVVEISGANPEQYQPLDGISLLPLLKDRKRLRRKAPIYGYRAYQNLYASVRQGPWKLLAYRSGRTLLYKVESDRFEREDLSRRRQRKLDNLVRKLREWEKEMKVEQYSGVQ